MALSDYWRSSFDPERVMSVHVTHWQEQARQQREEALTVEEPLEVRLAHRSLAVIMRTPGHDRELAMGFLFSEGVIASAADVLRIEEESDADGLPLPNVVNVTLRDPADIETVPPQTTAFERHFAVSSSCGLCGKNSISDLLISIPALDADAVRINAAVLYALPARLREAQSVFAHTGGLHAAALFSPDGDLLLLREDVGRHNAVDKLSGHGLLQGSFPYTRHILLVSGRTSFEIIQKALLARIPCVAAISAPSSMAVELAERGGLTLAGFLRGPTMNVYTHPERIL
jgi:FdhD protein